MGLNNFSDTCHKKLIFQNSSSPLYKKGRIIYGNQSITRCLSSIRGGLIRGGLTRGGLFQGRLM